MEQPTRLQRLDEGHGGEPENETANLLMLASYDLGNEARNTHSPVQQVPTTMTPISDQSYFSPFRPIAKRQDTSYPVDSYSSIQT